MPGELSDPEQMFPFYYDPRYDQTLNPFEPEAFNMDNYLQSIAFDIAGIKLSPEKLDFLKQKMKDGGLLNTNPGNEMFRSEASKIIKRLVMARKVARKCLI